MVQYSHFHEPGDLDAHDGDYTSGHSHEMDDGIMFHSHEGGTSDHIHDFEPIDDAHDHGEDEMMYSHSHEGDFVDHSHDPIDDPAYAAYLMYLETDPGH